MSANDNTESVNETPNPSFKTANGNVIVGLHAGQEYIKRMEILKTGKSPSSRDQIEQEIIKCAQTFGISPQDVDALKQQADSTGFQFVDEDTYQQYDDTDYSYQHYTDSDQPQYPIGHDHQYTHYDSHEIQDQDTDHDGFISNPFSSFNILSSIFGDNDGDMDGGNFNPMMNPMNNGNGNGNYKVYRIFDSSHPVYHQPMMQMQRTQPILQQQQPQAMMQVPVVSGQVQGGAAQTPPGPGGNGVAGGSVQGIVNPYGPQANSYYLQNPYQPQPAFNAWSPYLLGGMLIFFIILGICSCVMGVKTGKKLLRYAKVYKTEIIAATVKANQMKERKGEREKVALLQETEDNDEVTVTTETNTTPKDGN